MTTEDLNTAITAPSQNAEVERVLDKISALTGDIALLSNSFRGIANSLITDDGPDLASDLAAATALLAIQLRDNGESIDRELYKLQKMNVQPSAELIEKLTAGRV
jgi:hypothetical protein